MSPAPKRRTRATGFSPGGPRELKDAPRRQNRGGRRTTAAGKAAPTEPSRNAESMDLDTVNSNSVADDSASPRRGRGQTRSLRARTRSSSPLETTGLPHNRRTRSPPRDADAASSPRRRHIGLGRGLGKHARAEDTLEKVAGPAEEAGEEFSGSSVARPAKKLRAGDRGGEDIRRQMEREKRSSPLPTASAMMTPSRVGASVLRAGASALKYLGFRTESPRPVAEGDVGASPSINPEVSSREAPGSTAERSSEQSGVKSTDRPVSPDGGALAPAALHERSGEDLIEEQRRATELRKLLRLGRRNVVPLKAPSECGSDDEEAVKAAFRFTEELRPVSLPSYDASTRYVGWDEGKSGMLVFEEESDDDSKDDPKGKRTAQPILSSTPLSSAAPVTPVSRFAAPAAPFSPLAASAVPVSPSAAPIIPVSPSAAPVVPGPVVERGRKLVQIPIAQANILTAVKAALGWFNENSDTVPTPDELVDVLGKYRFGQLCSTTGRTYRAPSPSDPWSDDEFESDTGEPLPRNDGHPLPPPRAPHRRKITARSVPDYSGPPDAHLPPSYRGSLYKDLPIELQQHEHSWKIKQRDEIVRAQLADRASRGIDEDDYQMGIRAHAKQERKKRLREAQIVAAGKAEVDRRRAEQLALERRALKALADEKRAQAFNAAAGEPAFKSTPERTGRSRVARSPARAPRCASLPRCPTITEEADEEASTVVPAPAPEPERPSAASPATELKIAEEPASAPAAKRRTKKARIQPPIPDHWVGKEIDPRTNFPKGAFGFEYGFNYSSDSDDNSDEEQKPPTATPAANAGVSGVDVDVGALVDSIPSHELAALFAVTDVDATDVDIASIVESISRDDLEALIGIPFPSASESRDNDANFAISDDVMALVEAIPDGDFDEMMGGILAGCSSAGPDMGPVGVSS